MDSHSPRNEDDLSDVERRLAGWHPAAEGLDPDTMLFAAGLAAGRRGHGQFLWPVVCVVLAVQAAGLGVWALSERAERQALASRLRERAPVPNAPSAPAIAILPESPPALSPDSYLSLRRRVEQDPSRWLASVQPAGSQALGAPPPEPGVLRAGQWEAVLNQ
jgi:hypothetical protein